MKDDKVRVPPRFWLGGGAGCGGTVNKYELPICTINGIKLTEVEQRDWLVEREKQIGTRK